MRARSRVVALMALLMCVVAAGCGVSAEATPRDIRPKDAPFPVVAAPTPTDNPNTSGDDGQVFLVGPESLKSVGRRLAPRNDAFIAISTLLQGPTQAEAAEGLRTAIPSGTRLLAADLKDGVLTIDLSNDFLVVQGSEQRTAVAQLVFTATGTPDVDSVLFAIEGVQKEVPIDDGSLSAQPLTRFSYPSLDPVRLPPPNPGGGVTTTTTSTTTTTVSATTAVAPPATEAKP
ncbi:MAG TPA: GerMN domain-containing protein [Acidimicrobiales bacterium]|nr:GerMN domain-containing protein [Acidimicrobiales bacterium]